jgi:hypothetical protein
MIRVTGSAFSANTSSRNGSASTRTAESGSCVFRNRVIEVSAMGFVWSEEAPSLRTRTEIGDEGRDEIRVMI